MKMVLISIGTILIVGIGIFLDHIGDWLDAAVDSVHGSGSKEEPWNL